VRHAREVADLRSGLLDAPGVTDRTLREAALLGLAAPEPWTAYVEKVREASYRVTDQDVNAVLAAGGSEDAVFEMTLAAAVGAASDRLEAGLRALSGAG
jgi:hypothetical protein